MHKITAPMDNLFKKNKNPGFAVYDGYRQLYCRISTLTPFYKSCMRMTIPEICLNLPPTLSFFVLTKLE